MCDSKFLAVSDFQRAPTSEDDGCGEGAVGFAAAYCSQLGTELAGRLIRRLGSVRHSSTTSPARVSMTLATGLGIFTGNGVPRNSN